MRERIDRLGQITLALVWLGGVSYLIWTTVRVHLSSLTLTAYSVGALAFGALLCFCWPPRKKRKTLFYLLLAVGWASLGAANWLGHTDSLGLTLAGILVTLNLFISWGEWKSRKKSPSSTASPDDEAIESSAPQPEP